MDSLLFKLMMDRGFESLGKYFFSSFASFQPVLEPFDALAEVNWFFEVQQGRAKSGSPSRVELQVDHPGGSSYLLEADQATRFAYP